MRTILPFFLCLNNLELLISSVHDTLVTSMLDGILLFFPVNSFLIGINTYWQTESIASLISIQIIRKSYLWGFFSTPWICTCINTKWSSGFLLQTAVSHQHTPEPVIKRSVQHISEPDCLCEKCWLKSLQLSRQRKRSQIYLTVANSVLTLEFDLEGNGAIPPVLRFSIHLYILLHFSVLLSAESELFHFKQSILLLITIVCFGKMSQSKFSVKCYAFYMLFTTQTENRLLDAVCYHPKRTAFNFGLLWGAGRGRKENARYVVIVGLSLFELLALVV